MVVLPGARLVGFDERFRFDTFVVGMTTRDAADAARAAAESPGSEPASLVIAGPGLGKSHLLGAVASRARELRPGCRVVAFSADALRGVNVFETMRAACGAVLRRLTAGSSLGAA